MKKLIEKRNSLVEEIEKLMKNAEVETRALSDEEQSKYAQYKAEIDNIDKTVELNDEMRSFSKAKVGTVGESSDKDEVETRAFENYIRNRVTETRAENLTFTDNGAVIPTSIANKIISRVVEISPIYGLATKYNVKGTLTIPYYDETTQAITMSYADEFTEAESSIGKFTSITLTGYLARALSLVSLKLVNNSNFDIVSYVVEKMAESIAKWIEKELIDGTSGKVQGLTGVTNSVTTAKAGEITADDLIDVQESIKDVFQSGAIWVMNRATRAKIRKLKDKDGQYLLNSDVSARWGYTLLGKNVYTSDNMPEPESGKTVIYYGDFCGLAVKVGEEPTIQVIREKYAEQHCVGVLTWLEMDSKVEDAQKLSKLVMATA